MYTLYKITASLNISGANNPSYVKSNAQLSDAGNYSVVVGYACGSVTSDDAHLTVLPPPGSLDSSFNPTVLTQ